jgi:hypothetical protein
MMGRRYLLLVLLILSPPIKAAEVTSQVVVLKSTATPFAPGKIIGASETLSLSAGEHITAVAPNGQVIQLAGPYSGTIAIPPASRTSGSIVQTISNLMKSESPDRSTLAVTRQWQVEKAPTDPWAVHIAMQGPHCVLEKQTVSIWRSNAGKEASIRLSGGSDGRFAESRWPAGANSAPWPSSIEIANGRTYRAELVESREQVVFDVFVAPRALPTTVHRAVWIAEHGCRRQARMLLDTVAAE